MAIQPSTKMEGKREDASLQSPLEDLERKEENNDSHCDEHRMVKWQEMTTEFDKWSSREMNSSHGEKAGRLTGHFQKMAVFE